MDTLWSMSTTVREAERITGFLKAANLLNGEVWSRESQIQFQTLLIQYRYYLNNDRTQTYNKLTDEQIGWLKDKSHDMTYEQAESIFNTKDYTDPPLRGRTSMSPLKKLGLVFIVDDHIQVTPVGKDLLNERITLEDFMLDCLLKYQFPNPCEENDQGWNTKPFINALRLIKKVNQLCLERDLKQKGISSEEFGIFVLSLKRYDEIDTVAESILVFRENYEAITDFSEKENYRKTYIKDYLSSFNKPIKNVREYTDNMIRYLRLTKYIHIRGKYNNTYIDLEPRRNTEIEAILENDQGIAKDYTIGQWIAYMGTYGTYELPFETIEKLTQILTQIKEEIHKIESELNIPLTPIMIPTNKEVLKQKITEYRELRTQLQNEKIKLDYAQTAQIDNAIQALNDILSRNKTNLAKKFSIELEKWVNIALNIINDARLIKPNTPVGDDNEPIYTAPSNVPDIECYYEYFNAICEVTMLTSRDQWYNEGQPVMRHLRTFERNNPNNPNYCLFVAPKIHADTLNTFWNAVKHAYEGQQQKIIPLTIKQLIILLEVIKQQKTQGAHNISHQKMQQLFDSCTNISSINDSTLWLNHISNQLHEWQISIKT